MSDARHSLNIGVFLAGMAKCGTTTLSDLLFQHPQIMPPLKAPIARSHLSAQNKRKICNTWATKGGHIMLNRVKGMQVDWDKGTVRRPDPSRWKEKKFDVELARLLPDTAQRWPDSGQTIVADCSVSYFDCEGAAEAIHGLYPEARSIITLRHPTAWLYSCWSMHARQGKTNVKFTALYGLGNNKRKNREVRERLARSPAGRLSDYLERWLRVFAKERVKVVILEEWSKQPQQTAQELYRFIGADDSFMPKRCRRNSGKKKKITSYWLPVGWLAERYSRLRHQNAGPHDTRRDKHIKKTKKRLQRFCSSLRLYSIRRYTPLPYGLRRQLDNHFKPQVEAVEKLLGRSIPSWHRDS